MVSWLKAIVWELFYWFSISVSIFCKTKKTGQKVTINEKVSFTDYAFGIQPLDYHKLAINQKNDSHVLICQNGVITKLFSRCFVSLVKFSYWFQFHVIIMTGSGVMKIFFYKGFTINLGMGNTPVRGLTNIWRLWRVRDTKFGKNISDKMLLIDAKCQSYSFYRLSVIKGKPTKGREGQNYPLHHTD